MNYKIITWERYQQSIDNIIEFFKNKNIEKVVGIYKGGLVPAVQVANALKVPLDIVAFQHYDGNDENAQYVLNTGPAKNVLIIDDIIDTGKTIEKVLDIVKADNLYVASLIVKSKGFEVLRRLTSLDRYYIPYYEPSDKWIIFPWESLDNSEE